MGAGAIERSIYHLHQFNTVPELSSALYTIIRLGAAPHSLATPQAGFPDFPQRAKQSQGRQ
eukprot:gene17281-biopygen8320